MSKTNEGRQLTSISSQCTLARQIRLATDSSYLKYVTTTNLDYVAVLRNIIFHKLGGISRNTYRGFMRYREYPVSNTFTAHYIWKSYLWKLPNLGVFKIGKDHDIVSKITKQQILKESVCHPFFSAHCGLDSPFSAGQTTSIFFVLIFVAPTKPSAT